MTDDLLSKFAELNPVGNPDRLIDLGPPDPPADPVLRAVLEHGRTNGTRPDPMRQTQGRHDDMQTTQTTAVRQDRQATAHRRTGRVAALAAAAVVILGTIAGSVVLTDGDQGPVGAAEIGSARAETIERMVEAINDRSAAAFATAFVDEGSFHARGSFRESSTVFINDQPIADTALVQTWMVFLDAWGHEARVRGCESRDESVLALPRSGTAVTCEVTARWHTLSMEVTEQWEYVFAGDLLKSWRYQPVDLDPKDRSLPLGFSGLQQWETWLQTNRPDDAARYLRPRDTMCSTFDCSPQWVEDLTSDDPERMALVANLLSSTEQNVNIDGHIFHPAGLIPYDPRFADEIEASIHAYLESR